MTKEDQLIERIAARVGRSRRLGARSGHGPGLAVGLGDDACVLRASRGQEWVASCDAFLEEVHFIRRLHSPATIGYKALARATSDLAAMGAVPRCFLLGLALPARLTGDWLDAFLGGMARAARRFGMELAGGDTSHTDAIAINITVFGEVRAERAILRSGARPGDRIFVTGRLGAAQLGLEIVMRGLSRRASLRRYLAPHLLPDPPIAFGQWLARRELASAMMDLSDGLSTDLDRLCRASGVGARIREANLPAVRVPDSLRRRGIDALKLARDGGEDYQLLFTVPASAAPSIPRQRDGVRITEIGEIVRGRGVSIISADGASSPLPPRGWDHFAR
ncbi:MAG: thiamine-phosphate kinase [Candidatus Acidiferrales bacterium]|jgi:thiamine-monophosphate kinase